MKQFILVDASFQSSSMLEALIDDTLLKELAYGMKYKTPRLEYGNILIPLVLMDENDHDFSMNYYKLFSESNSAGNSILGRMYIILFIKWRNYSKV